MTYQEQVKKQSLISSDHKKSNDKFQRMRDNFVDHSNIGYDNSNS